MTKLLHNYEVPSKIEALHGIGYEVNFAVCPPNTTNMGKIHAHIHGSKLPSYSGFGDTLEDALLLALTELIADLEQSRASHEQAAARIKAQIDSIESYAMYKVRTLKNEETEAETESAA